MCWASCRAEESQFPPEKQIRARELTQSLNDWFTGTAALIYSLLRFWGSVASKSSQPGTHVCSACTYRHFDCHTVGWCARYQQRADLLLNCWNSRSSIARSDQWRPRRLLQIGTRSTTQGGKLVQWLNLTEFINVIQTEERAFRIHRALLSEVKVKWIMHK